MTLNDLKALMTADGYTPSAASWEDDQHAFAFSQETAGPKTYNHPRATYEYNKSTGKLYKSR